MGELFLILGMALTWALGTALVLALPRPYPLLPQPGGVAWAAGTGMLAGAFVVTLLMRALGLLGMPFGLATIGAPVLALAAGFGWLAWRRERAGAPGALCQALRTMTGSGLRGALRAVWWLLLAWMALRFALLLVEVLVRPLYPWDAWTQWATKARVWFELKAMVPFVRPEVWFGTPAAGFIDAGPHYPVTVPLLMVWANVLLGRWDDAAMNLPFWLLAAGFAVAVYGFLRAQGFEAVGALVGAWIASALPLANAHVALAGYADLPLALYFALAALAGYRWSLTREWADALLAVLFAVACPMLKVPGIVWMVALVPGLVLVALPRLGLRIVTAGFVAGAVALLALAQTTPRILGYALHLDFAPDWTALGNSYFMFGNWNLLWYGVLAVAVLARRQLFAPPLVALTVVLIAGLFFLFIVFGFTNARDWVTDQTTVNRATLHMAPLMAVWMLLAFRGWMQARATAQVPAPAAA